MSNEESLPADMYALEKLKTAMPLLAEKIKESRSFVSYVRFRRDTSFMYMRNIRIFSAYRQIKGESIKEELLIATKYREELVSLSEKCSDVQSDIDNHYAELLSCIKACVMLDGETYDNFRFRHDVMVDNIYQHVIFIHEELANIKRWYDDAKVVLTKLSELEIEICK
jgi:hypothetical protein